MQLFIRKNNNKENIQNILMCYRQMVKTERKSPLTMYIFLLLPLEWSLKTIDPIAHQGPENLLGEEALLSRKCTKYIK